MFYLQVRPFKDSGNDVLSLDCSTQVKFLDTNILCYGELVYRSPVVIFKQIHSNATVLDCCTVFQFISLLKNLVSSLPCLSMSLFP